MTGVPWRRVVVTFAALAVALGGVFVAFRADGFEAVDATVPRATRWFVDNDLQRLVLADGFAGKLLAKVEITTDSNSLEVVQSPSGAAVLDRSGATSRTIDSAALRVGSAQPLDLIGDPNTVVGVGQAGVVAVAPDQPEGVLLPPEGEPLRFDVGVAGADDATRVAPDGAVWTIGGGSFARITTTGREVFATGLASARFSLVGNTALLVDADRGRVRFGDGSWLPLPSGVPASEIVVQQPGPASTCGWIGGNDGLWCVGAESYVEQVDIDGLGIGGSDLLAIAGDAGVLVRRLSSEVVPLDWRAGTVLDAPSNLELVAGPDASLSVASSVDLVWVEDTAGDNVWAINPWGVERLRKTDEAPVLGESGEPIDTGDEGETTPGSGVGGVTEAPTVRTPDNDGVDDPPEAADDQVTARFGVSVPIAVTANDHDPDGEAIAVVRAEDGARGRVTISSASTVVYAPQPNTVGIDTFTYTIADGDGTEATATVTVQLLPADAPNTAPKGTPDTAETSIDVSVVVDVLANDIDPERDPLQIGTFTAGDARGVVRRTEGPTGQPALEFTPLAGISGTATFEYVPVDAFGAPGEPVEVTVTIASATAENRPPIAQPDAVRVRRDVAQRVNVLANDRDPDGDPLTLTVESFVADGLEVVVQGNELVVTARAGAGALVPFEYSLRDGQNPPSRGFVLVSVIGADEANSPPLANADAETAVVGVTKTIDVIANDTDPDLDPLTIVSVAPPTDGSGIGSVRVRNNQIEYIVERLASDEAVIVDRFTYVITDGRDHTATGDVTVRVLPEPVDEPPFTRDDSATTFVDTEIVVDVLSNDGDPSGETVVLRNQIGCTGGASAEVTPGSQVRFTPPTEQTGSFDCDYTIGNSRGLTATGKLTVNVVAASVKNLLPAVPLKEVPMLVGESVTIELLEGVTDPDAEPGDPPLEVIDFNGPNAGQAQRSGNTVTYVAPDSAMNVTMSYVVRDVDGGTTTGRIAIAVVPPDPVPPVAVDDITSVVNDRAGISVVVPVLNNDLDPDAGPGSAPLRVTDAAVIGDGGVATFSSDSVTVVVNDRFFGRLRVGYEVTDEQGEADNAEIIIDVTEPANRPPTPGDDVAEVTNGASITVPIADNDLDPDADPLDYALVSGASSTLGEAQLQGDATLTFDAAPGASGTAVITYSVSDGEFTRNAVVRIRVLPCSAALPEAPDLNLATGYQQPIFVDLTLGAKNGDIVEVGAPLGQSSGVYTPPVNFNDNVTFTYVVRNACGIDAVGRVLIDVNQDPAPGSVNANMGRRDTLTVPVEQLASDPNLEPLVIQRLDGAPPWVALAADSRGFTATPANVTGTASFTAVVADPGGLTATVPITINLVNLAPVPVADQFLNVDGPISMDVLANDSDPDGDTFSLQTVPASVTFTNGVTVALEVRPSGRIRIDPGAGVGTATFDYGIIDSQNLPSAQTARVTITVNTPPIAPPVDVTVTAGTTQTVTVAPIDPDGGPFVITIQGDASPFTIVVNGLELQISAPPDAPLETTALNYRVTDPLGAFATGSLNITVVAPPPPPDPPPG